MAQVADGKRDLMEPLVRRYANSLLTFIRRMIGDHHRSEELFQEVFLAVWLKRRRYQFPRPFKAWLFAIALNRCRADFRKRRPVLTLDYNEADPAADNPKQSPPDVLVSHETAHLVAQAVAQLPTQQRTVMVLRVWHELPYAEIAAVVGRSEATVRSHMHHGLLALKKILEPRLNRSTDS